MPQYFPFQPNPTGPFQFAPVLDGQPYQAQVVWSVFGQRWHLKLLDAGGTVVVFTAVVGSSDFMQIQAARWNDLRRRAILAATHGLPVGTVAALTVRGASPAAYNGTFAMTIESPTTLSYELPTNPGGSVAPGYFGREVDLVAGLFQNSSLVFRDSAQRFEVWP